MSSPAPEARATFLPVGTPEHFRWLRGIVGAVLVLNLFDAVFTVLWVEAGLALEANAFLRDLVHGNTVLFVASKMALVSLGSWLLWHHRRRPIAVIGIFAAFGLYYGVLLYHLAFSSLLVRNSF